MYRQVGNIQLENGIAKRGLLVRHLVLPENIAGSNKIFSFLKNEISPSVYVNIMAQYRPYGDIPDCINRRITADEYRDAIEQARNTGLKNIIEQNAYLDFF